MASLVSILFIWIVVYFCSAYYQAKVLGIPWHRLHVQLDISRAFAEVV